MDRKRDALVMAECAPLSRAHISVRGVVQGVGFRPFVYRLAREYALNGWVRNTSAGVEIEIEGAGEAIESFLRDLQTQTPPLARIEGLESSPLPPLGERGFVIHESQAEAGRYQLISPDIAVCADCQRELLDPADRRYGYAFTNCTNCGPRFTIIEDIPYDRAKTTMRAFCMCPACQAEYDDPLNRRFHAQPNACPVCGPQLTLLDNQGEAQQGAPLQEAARLLGEGRVLAIKGLGGFHLAGDATNPQAVQLLRQRKQRPDKPFAVMVADLEMLRAHCQEPTAAEMALLTAPQCPIVLLPWRAGSTIAQEVAPRYRYLGVMLPYTPLHHLLLRAVGRPLVMTSGNLSEEPIAQDNDEALRRLGHLADYFLLHDRGIYSRYDDSVWFAPSSGPQPIRRARGYAPAPLKLPFQLPQVLACGAESKNTFCLTKDNYAFLSQHIGDLENLETLEHYERTIALYRRLFRVSPVAIAHDLHPDYMATRYAQELAAQQGWPLIGVQHHYAHLASCLADNGYPAEADPAIGVILDGTGFGTDGAIWGGEFLVGDYRHWRRAGQLEYLPLAGGEGAIRSPYRLAAAYSLALLGRIPELPSLRVLTPEERAVIGQQVERGLNAPPTSSCGRLFDAVAALCGFSGRVSYEAQAAIELEMAAMDAEKAEAYPFAIAAGERHIIRLAETWAAIVADLQAGRSPSFVGARFHATVARMILEMCERIAAESGLRTAALSGGCFQNRLLLELTVPPLRRAGFGVLLHRQAPCNDGGLALGQAVVAGLSTM
jgi:hydrogenase maturation protein HypF